VSGELFVMAFGAAWFVDGEQRTIGRPADTAEIPMLIRRRLRGAALTAVACALEPLRAAARPVGVVFCSRHGDLQRTQRLLVAMAEGRAPAPLGFSLSVHNALAGMLDLVRQERTGHTSIAAGPDTFAAALIEASARLWSDRDRAVLLLHVEDQIPESLQSQTDPSLGGTMLAALLEPAQAAARPRAVVRRVPEAGARAQASDVEARKVISVLEGGPPIRLASRADFDWVVEATA
jgi:hypothetical protein